MPYGQILGTRVGVHTNPKRKDRLIPCPRCGVRREPNHSSDKDPRTILCHDCKYTMSEEEVAIWYGKSTATS